MTKQNEWLKNKVIELSELEDNWDGYDALKPFHEVIDNVEALRHILNNDFIDRIDDIYPNPHGTITIEWTNTQHEKLSLEIGKTKYSYFVLYNGAEPKKVDKREIEVGYKEIISDLDKLAEKNYLLDQVAKRPIELPQSNGASQGTVNNGTEVD